MTQLEREKAPKLRVWVSPQIAYQTLITLMHYPKKKTFVLIQINFEFILKSNERKGCDHKNFFFIFFLVSSNISENHNYKSQQRKAEIQEYIRAPFCTLCCG